MNLARAPKFWQIGWHAHRHQSASSSPSTDSRDARGVSINGRSWLSRELRGMTRPLASELLLRDEDFASFALFFDRQRHHAHSSSEQPRNNANVMLRTRKGVVLAAVVLDARLGADGGICHESLGGGVSESGEDDGGSSGSSGESGAGNAGASDLSGKYPMLCPSWPAETSSASSETRPSLYHGSNGNPPAFEKKRVIGHEA